MMMKDLQKFWGRSENWKRSSRKFTFWERVAKEEDNGYTFGKHLLTCFSLTVFKWPVVTVLSQNAMGMRALESIAKHNGIIDTVTLCILES